MIIGTWILWGKSKQIVCCCGEFCGWKIVQSGDLLIKVAWGCWVHSSLCKASDIKPDTTPPDVFGQWALCDWLVSREFLLLGWNEEVESSYVKMSDLSQFSQPYAHRWLIEIATPLFRQICGHWLSLGDGQNNDVSMTFSVRLPFLERQQEHASLMLMSLEKLAPFKVAASLYA